MLVNVGLLVASTAALVGLGAVARRRCQGRPGAVRAVRAVEGLMVATLSLGAAAVAAEFVSERFVDVPASLRRQGYAEYRPGRLALRPRATLTWGTRNPAWKTFTVRTNADGLRTHVAPGSAAAEGVRRVMFLGDSFTFGVGLDAEETYPAQVAALLSRDGARWEAVNAGVPGYNLASTVDLFEWSIARYRPAVAVFTVHDTDDQRPDFHDAAHAREEALDPLLRRFALYRFARAGRDVIRYREGDPTNVSRSSDARSRRRLREAADRIAAAARAHDCAVVVHVLSHDMLDARAVDILRVDDAQVVTTAWRADDARAIPRDGHPSPEGARWLAERVAPAVRAAGVRQ